LITKFVSYPLLFPSVSSTITLPQQRINGTSFVFSAAMPALSAVAASEAISILTSNPSLLTTLHENTFILRSVLDKVDGIIIPSHPASPIIHIYLKPTSAPTLSPTTALSLPLSRSSSSSGGHKSNPSSLIPTPPPLPIDTPYETAFLQEIIEECLSQGILLTRSKRLKEQEAIDWKPSIRIAVTSALGRKEVEKAAGVIKAAVGKVLGKRR
jgi:serine palmitoyltransferase